MDYMNDNMSNYKCRGIIHVVKAGDNLYRIAQMHDVSLYEIMKANPYVNIYNLQIGDEICVPTMDMNNENVYIVKDGDTIRDIMNNLKSDFTTLIKHNPEILDTKLEAGKTIRVPMRQENR